MLFHEAIKVAPISSHNDVSIYAGEMDGEWCVESVPNGGYVLAQIIEACVQQQSQCPHLDPIHVTAHFLNAASLSPFEVHIRCLKRGKRFTNLVAELLQDKIVKVISHLIFGVLESPLTEGCGSENAINLLPPSPYARRVPLHHHPAQAPTTGLDRRYKFHSRFDVTLEPEIASQNNLNSPRRATSSDTIGGGGVDYGLWCGFKDKDEAVTISSLPFFADISLNAPVLLPKEYSKGFQNSWFPTMTMNIEYKFYGLLVPSLGSKMWILPYVHSWKYLMYNLINFSGSLLAGNAFRERRGSTTTPLYSETLALTQKTHTFAIMRNANFTERAALLCA